MERAGGACVGMDQPELELLAEYRRGRVEALGQLVEHYRRPLFGFILRMTEGREDAEEIFQEVWFRVIKHQHRYRPKSFRSWLFKIAHNLIIDRARKRRPVVDLHGAAAEGEDPLETRIEAGGLSPAEEIDAAALGRRITAAVRRLPGPQREVFVMRVEGDLPFKEIARVQGTSINTALARMHYAVHRLRETMRDDYEELRKVTG